MHGNLGQPRREVKMSDYRIEAATKEEWAERALKAEAKLSNAVEALGLLDKAAGETARMGAATGPHWTRLTIALLISRATLAEMKGPADDH